MLRNTPGGPSPLEGYQPNPNPSPLTGSAPSGESNDCATIECTGWSNSSLVRIDAPR